jgi:hypothetical protein
LKPDQNAKRRKRKVAGQRRLLTQPRKLNAVSLDIADSKTAVFVRTGCVKRRRSVDRISEKANATHSKSSKILFFQGLRVARVGRTILYTSTRRIRL